MKRLVTTAKVKIMADSLVLCAVALFALPAHAYAATMPPEVLAAIQKNYPDGLPRYLTPEEQQWLQEQRALGVLEVAPLAATAPPTGVVFTPPEYDPVYGVLVSWEPGSYLPLLTDFIVGVTKCLSE